MATVMYEFTNTQPRTLAAQAIASYAPSVAGNYFKKLECFCFNEYTLKPGESRRWPVVFYVDRKLPHDVNTITLSYTFFEVGGKVPRAGRRHMPPDPAAMAASGRPCAWWPGPSSACAAGPTRNRISAGQAAARHRGRPGGRGPVRGPAAAAGELGGGQRAAH
jgi:hypothetical protein